MFPELLITSVLILLFSAGFALAASGRDDRHVRIVVLGSTIIASALIAVVAIFTLLTNETFAFTVYQPFPAVSISFFVDRLAAVFLLIIAIVSGCVAAYSTE
jgi:formate hydrogenlyase subunit 3/multisubunit Na+/H+ antiporter MnhD subunit